MDPHGNAGPPITVRDRCHDVAASATGRAGARGASRRGRGGAGATLWQVVGVIVTIVWR